MDINSFNQMSGVSYLYLFICPPMELFKIGVSGNIPQRLDTISKPYVKEYGPGYRWICLGNLAVSDMHIARVENRFHSKFRFEFQVEEDSLYKSSEIYKLDKSIDFLAKLFFETADSLFAE